MRRVRDVSRAVRELVYSDDDKTLDVVWASGDGRAYRFFDVPPEVFDWLLNQPSKGGFIRRKIIGTYREVRLDDNGLPMSEVGDSRKGRELEELLAESLLAVGTMPPPRPFDIALDLDDSESE